MLFKWCSSGSVMASKAVSMTVATSPVVLTSWGSALGASLVGGMVGGMLGGLLISVLSDLGVFVV